MTLLEILLDYNYKLPDSDKLRIANKYTAAMKHVKTMFIHEKFPQVGNPVHTNILLRKGLDALSHGVVTDDRLGWITEVSERYKAVRLDGIELMYLYINNIRFDFTSLQAFASEIRIEGVQNPPNPPFKNNSEFSIFINDHMYNVVKSEIYKNEVLFLWTR